MPEGTNPDESVAMPKGRKRSAHDRKRKHAKESQSKKANKLEEGEVPEASRLRPPQNGEASSSTAQFYTCPAALMAQAVRQAGILPSIHGHLPAPPPQWRSECPAPASLPSCLRRTALYVTGA